MGKGCYHGKRILEASQKRRMERKEFRKDKKIAKISARQGAKTERTGIRQTEKTFRVEERSGARVSKAAEKFSAHKTAYENGIDPKAAAWQGGADMTNSVAQAVSNIFGKSQWQTGFNQPNSASVQLGGDKSILIIGGIALLAILMFNKK